MSGDCKSFCRSKPGRRRRAFILPALLTAGAALSAEAHAGIRHTLDIPAQPMRGAVVALALKTDVSVGGADPDACAAASRPIRGNYAAEAALRAMMAGSRCKVRRIDDVTFRLELAAPAPVAAASPPVAPPAVRILQPPAPAEVVIVSRRPTPVDSIPRSVSVISAVALRGNDRDLASLAVGVPGMAVTNLGPGRDKILLRGVSDSVITGRTQSIVGLYLDDTPITYNAPDPDLLLVDMARVEVLKGPQGALYGQGSLSGVVRLVSNAPDAGRYEGEVTAGAGVTEGGQSSWRATAMLNLPLLRDTLAVRGVIYDESSGGFIRADTAGPAGAGTPIRKTGEASNTTDRYGGRVGVLWRPTPGLTLTATAVLQHLASRNSQYVYSQTAYHREAQLAEPHDNNIEDLAFGMQKETAWGTLKVSLNQIRHNLRTGYDAQPLGPVVSVPNSGVLFYDEDQGIRLATQEVTLVSPSDRRIRWLAGIFAAQGEERLTPHLVDVFTGRTLYDENRLDKTDDAALFGQVAWDLAPRWSMAVGLRAALARHETFSQINHVRLTGYDRMGDIEGRIHSRRLTHSVVMRYQATPSLMLYAQAADGFRTGGFNTTTLTATVIPTRYAGDHLDSYETGLRWRSDDNRWRLNLAAFAIRWYDIQSDQLRSTGLPVTLNLGDGRNLGLEAEADWKPVEGLTFHAAGQVNDPRLDHPDPLFTRSRDAGMPYIARLSFSVGADWRTSLAGHAVSSHAVLSHRSRSPLNYGPLHDVRMDAFTNLDLSSTIAFDRLSVALRIDNAAAAKGNSFAYGNPFTLDGANQITPLRPRTIWFSASRRF